MLAVMASWNFRLAVAVFCVGEWEGTVDLHFRRTLSCGHGLSLLVTSFLWGLKAHAFPAGVAA
ncbi:hypothetical protein CSV76_06145 [Sporosarcina sp. P17b]|nr:hypothetical protein SporoP32a_11680 [Sporosarcina ureae]PIC74071.1 hypothetical protein CSV76_06145 [Sporosarcina sp. P17b]